MYAIQVEMIVADIYSGTLNPSPNVLQIPVKYEDIVIKASNPAVIDMYPLLTLLEDMNVIPIKIIDTGTNMKNPEETTK